MNADAPKKNGNSYVDRTLVDTLDLYRTHTVLVAILFIDSGGDKEQVTLFSSFLDIDFYT
jgi:hypothetical protein